MQLCIMARNIFKVLSFYLTVYFIDDIVGGESLSDLLVAQESSLGENCVFPDVTWLCYHRHSL